MDEIYNDARFAHIPRDPAFKRIPKSERKVKIDKRFQSMFYDKRFKVKYTVDKRGRPITNSSTENLRRYYALDSSSGSEEASDDEASDDGIEDDPKDLNSGEDIKAKGIKKKKKIREKVKDDLDEGGKISTDYSLSDTNEDIVEGKQKDYYNSEAKQDHVLTSVEEKIRSRLQDMTVDYARGEGVLLSDSSSDEESSDTEEDDDLSHGWGELDQDADKTEESTHRLAICNMDWDRVRAADLMVLLSSFLPKGGAILSVAVYPSEYGLQRMKEEEEKGPIELRGEGDHVLKDSDLGEEESKKKNHKKKTVKDEHEEGDRYHTEKLRQYQLNRLKYYYAVVVCDSVDTADVLYKECDGREYESSASHLDLRFIPDDTTFEQEPREKCTELPDFAKYEPELFVTTALTQSKVKLTWDETDPRRAKINEKLNSGRVDDVDENDLKIYLASSSSESETDGEGEDKEATVSKYRSLLQSVDASEEDKKEKNMEMAVTWGIGLQQKVEKRLKEGKPDEMTPFEKYMQKRKEKRKAKREEQLKKKQQFKEEAGKAPEESVSEDDVPSDVDMNDPYFKEEFQKEEFAHTQKKSSKKISKKKANEGGEEDEETKRKKAELELLLMDEEDNKKHFSLKDILVEDSNNKKKKKKKKQLEEQSTAEKQDDFQIDVKDSRFSALFTSHLYNIDPADPHYKKTKGMEALREEKLKRRGFKDEVPVKKRKVEAPAPKDAELSLLVKNVKRKAKNLNKQ